MSYKDYSDDIITANNMAKTEYSLQDHDLDSSLRRILDITKFDNEKILSMPNIHLECDNKILVALYWINSNLLYVRTDGTVFDEIEKRYIMFTLKKSF